MWDRRLKFASECHERSQEIFGRLNGLNSEFSGTGAVLAVTGSLARMEVTGGSDFDAYVITNQQKRSDEAGKELWEKASKLANLKSPSQIGSFGSEKISTVDNIVENIGGLQDDTEKLSQRVALILESKFVGDRNISDDLMTKIINRYISENITNHQLGMFMLNDIIRYYRTICVDFEYKTEEQGKPWGIRNIKLVYSRKLVYFAGVIMCAELAQKSAREKREFCRSFIDMTPIERILSILGDDAIKPLELYDDFLKALSNERIRSELASVSSSQRGDCDTFVRLKNQGHHFAWKLRSAFMRNYDGTHPIHKALMF